MKSALRRKTLTERRESAVGVHLEGIVHSFGTFSALRSVSLDIAPGEFLTLLGPSGSGKTTLLRLIGGLLPVQDGSIRIGDRDVTELPPRKREIGFVFQNYAVFPHLTVFDNVAFPLRLRKVAEEEVRTRVDAALEMVSLDRFGHRLPAQLSGGQQQRVALSRAFVYEPTVLLMDEPLGALDKRLRRGLQIEIRRLQQELGITTVYVTHDQEEAFSMSDRIAVMDNGRILQVADPTTIYYEPASDFVADFVGDMNRVDGVIESIAHGSAVLRCGDQLSIAIESDDGPIAVGDAAACGVRPERVRVGSALETANVLPATVRAVRFNGNHFLVYLTIAEHVEFVAEIHGVGTVEFSAGQAIQVGWDLDDGMVFAGPSTQNGREAAEVVEPG